MASKKKVKKLANGGKKKVKSKKTKGDRLIERRLNKDPFKNTKKSRLA